MIKKMILLLAMGLMAATPAFASTPAQITTVLVTGHSQKEISPDIAKLNLSVTTTNANLAQAKTENSQSANQVFAKLKEQGIADRQIKTEAYRIDPLYSYENDQLPKLKGYKVTNNIEITTSIEKVGMLVNDLTIAGANEINSIRFEKENDAEIKNDVLSEAVKDALRKADVIASVLNKRVAQVKVVNESDTSYRPVMGETRAYNMAKMDAAAPTIAAGKITVGATVQLTVELE